MLFVYVDMPDVPRKPLAAPGAADDAFVEAMGLIGKTRHAVCPCEPGTTGDITADQMRALFGGWHVAPAKFNSEGGFR